MAMDTLRGAFESGDPASRDDLDSTPQDSQITDIGSHEDNNVRDIPPAAIGQDERRMQVRAYNHWASLLGERTFPSIEDLEPNNLPDFGPYSVLLDFSAGIDDPIVQYLGATLGQECGTDGQIERLSDVPPRSLLSRITDHYMQIMANQAPIGFEAEFVNQRGSAILYRGILLPFSSDDETIDFIYGVINWKEMAEQATADELLLEIDQALDAQDADDSEEVGYPRHADPIADWADSPAHEAGEQAPVDETLSDNVADFDLAGDMASINADDDDLPMPDFGQYALDDPYAEEDEDEEGGAGYSFASLADYIEAPAKKAVDLEADQFDPADYQVEDTSPRASEPFEQPDPDQAAPDAPLPPADLAAREPDSENEQRDANNTGRARVDVFGSKTPDDHDAGNHDAGDFEEAAQINDDLPENADLHDCLASARELAGKARVSEDRSRHALYAAVGRAYDFSLAAKDAPRDYDALVEQSGLTVQDRAPMTPVVKLVFGPEYDKTRLTEYAAVLSHAHRLELERGALAAYLADADGGLKGIVNAERRLRREESGKPVDAEDQIRAALAKKLRALEALSLELLNSEGPEFSLVMVRRDGVGGIDMIGEVDDDLALIERAGRKLVG